MIDKILKTKPGLLIGLSLGPFVLGHIITGVRVMVISFEDMHKFRDVLSSYQPIAYALLLPMVIISLLWLWAVYARLYPKVPAKTKMHSLKFKIGFCITAIDFIGMFVFIIFTGNQFNNHLAIIFPLYVLGIFSLAYCAYFLAKVYKALLLRETLKFSEYLEDFFMFLIPPAGMFTMHAKIKELIEKD
ncbi:hypothetical protein BKI52_40490 [marine bacterium AO1-C]|nr:hypothetical protein BKI52_40490 [marine bacterium AO1-C]